MGHISLVSHEPLGTIGTSEGKISSMATLVTNQLVSVSELFLTVFTSVSLGVLVYPGVLCQVFSLSKAFVTDVTNE